MGEEEVIMTMYFPDAETEELVILIEEAVETLALLLQIVVELMELGE